MGALNEQHPQLQLRALLSRFEIVLATEYEALRTRDTEALYDVIEEKMRLAAEIEQLTPTIKIPTPQSPAAEQAEWETIRKLLAKCELENRTNGATISANQKFATSMLDIITGRRAVERTYGASGRLSNQAARLRFERV